MASKKASLQASPLDVGAAQQAFEELQSELLQLNAAQLQPVRVDLQLTSAIVYSVATRDNTGNRRARLALVAQGGSFDITLLDRLPLMALAAWHTRRQQIEAVDAASNARVAEVTLKEAQAARSRMLRVLTYYFEDHVEYSKRIAAIRAGSGYLDLANDLLSVADFYEVPDVNAIVSIDPVYYRADDPALARQLAQQLFCGLGLAAEGEAARWTDMAQRAWTLMSQNYETLRAAGRLVFRNDEDVDDSYPSLIAAVRAPATRVSSTAAATGNSQPANPQTTPQT